MISLTPVQLALGIGVISVSIMIFDSWQTWEELDALRSENAALRRYAARVWNLFAENGAMDTYDLREVDAVRDGLKKLGAIR